MLGVWGVDPWPYIDALRTSDWWTGLLRLLSGQIVVQPRPLIQDSVV